MLPELTTLLQYENALLLERFSLKHSVNQQQSQEILKDLLRYFWLSQHHFEQKKKNPHNKALDFKVIILEEMQLVDELWHEFILMTRDYQTFCYRYFGHFIHHDIQQQAVCDENIYQETERYLTYIYDYLGEAVLKRWFAICLQE